MLDPGKELNIHRWASVYSSNANISEMVKLPLTELMRQEQESIEKEKTIHGQMCGLEKAWIQQAEQTIRLRKAQQYLKTPDVKHTSNRQVNGEYGWNEVSNMVYKLRWRAEPVKTWDRQAKADKILGWSLDWYIIYNTPNNPDNSGNGLQIAGQSGKRFPDKTAMEKYLNGRINAHAHLFKEISPPIPKGQEGRFSINGVLLPGYTVEVPEKTPQEAADDLLAFLDDEDIADAPLPEEPAAPDPAPPSPAQAHLHTPKKAPRHSQKKSAPTR